LSVKVSEQVLAAARYQGQRLASYAGLLASDA
jgi:hypothetical protein